MSKQKPDILVILSIVFVLGTAFTSLSVNSEDPAPRVSQHTIR